MRPTPRSAPSASRTVALPVRPALTPLGAALSAAVLALALALPGLARAAGSSDETPPTPTQTTQECKKGQVWDDKTKACVDPKESRLDNDTLYRAVRELAYAGRPDEALSVLAAMTEGESDRVLTYRGFIARKMGRIDEGMSYYRAALDRNPDNLLTRSYMGQGYVQQGKLDLARAELREIRARGGAGTWAEASLDAAIRTGHTFSY